MSVAYIHEDLQNVSDYLGPAEVLDFEGGTPIVRVLDARVRAELALAFPYEPVVGDVLLVISKGAHHYVIGLLKARGEVAMRFMGDVKLQAVGGKLSLEGDEGVAIRGRKVEVTARDLKTLAESVVERAGSVYRRVRETLDVHAGDKRELVDGDISTRAGSVNTATEGIVTINGKEIHLG